MGDAGEKRDPTSQSRLLPGCQVHPTNPASNLDLLVF